MRQALAAICCFVFFSGPVRAEEQVLGYHVVVHATEAHSTPVPGRPGHTVGIAAFRGLAIFDGGQIATHRYSGSFDFVNGSGPFRGYAQWMFEDGSQLAAAYVGDAKATAGGGITFTAKHTDVTGAGRYAGLRGEGTFAGRRIDVLADSGDTYFRGTLKLNSDAR